ncbi:hypothetical protein Emag_000004 [Eimeria magna]
MQTVRAEDQAVGDVGYKEISFGLCVFVAPPVVRDVLRYLPRQEPRSRPVQSWVTLLHSEDQVLRQFPRRGAGEDDFLPDYCPPYVLYSRTAFRRLGPSDLDRTFASPTLWEGPHFADFRGPERVMQSGEPCWLVVCSLRDVHREMVYDRATQDIFPRHRLRRFVEIPPRMCPRNMDMEYSYAVAPYRVEPEARFHAPLVFWVPMDHGIRDSLAAGLLTITISTPSTPQVGIHAPSVTSSVLSEEDRARGTQDDEPDPPSPVISSAEHFSTPEPVDEVQSPSAPANDNSAGADADSSPDASHSTSH